MDFEHAIKCDCGAVTVTMNGENYSMKRKEFNRLFGKHRISQKVCSCDYCVNHWGLDLCACGSGEKVGKCKEGFKECNTPMQTLGQCKESILWK